MRRNFFARAEPAVHQNSVRLDDLLRQAECDPAPTGDVVVDLTDVLRVDTSDLNAALRLHLSLREQGRKLVLSKAGQAVSDVVRLTRLDRVIEFHDGAMPQGTLLS